MADLGGWIRDLLGAKERQRPDPSLPEAPARSDGPRSSAEDHNDFALALYRELHRKPGNLFFSPFSIRTALAMTYAGARGETAAEMRRALHFASSDEGPHVAFAEIIDRLNAAGRRKYEMAVANSLWMQDGAPLETGFLDLVARHYSGGANSVDFRSGAEAARETINRWVEDKTKQKIQELIPSGGLGADTRLVLANAVYFKGMWVLQFAEALTSDEPFYLEGGGNVQVPLMHQDDYVRYCQAGGYQAVELDYRGGDLSMLVLLPQDKDGLGGLEAKLSADMLRDCVAKMLVREVDLFLPRFRMTWETELGSPLRTLGMPLAFTRFQADFSGVDGRKPPHNDSLFLSAVFHKAFVDVNEEGTEAAAATGVGMCESAMPGEPEPVPIFRADHPFLFAIRDRKSGVILFLGRMTDPKRGY